MHQRDRCVPGPVSPATAGGGCTARFQRRFKSAGRQQGRQRHARCSNATQETAGAASTHMQTPDAPDNAAAIPCTPARHRPPGTHSGNVHPCGCGLVSPHHHGLLKYCFQIRITPACGGAARTHGVSARSAHVWGAALARAQGCAARKGRGAVRLAVSNTSHRLDRHDMTQQSRGRPLVQERGSSKGQQT